MYFVLRRTAQLRTLQIPHLLPRPCQASNARYWAIRWVSFLSSSSTQRSAQFAQFVVRSSEGVVQVLIEASGRPRRDGSFESNWLLRGKQPKAVTGINPNKSALLPANQSTGNYSRSNAGSVSTIFMVSRLTVITRSSNSSGYFGLPMVSVAQSLALLLMLLSLSSLSHWHSITQLIAGLPLTT